MNLCFNLGPVPSMETCASVGAPGYEKQSLLEGKVFRRMLERVNPVPEEVTARYVVKTFPHEFGDYREVCIEFDGEDPATLAFASNAESNVPENWDSQATLELLWFGRRESYNDAVARGVIGADEIPENYRRLSVPVFPEGTSLADMLGAL